MLRAQKSSSFEKCKIVERQGIPTFCQGKKLVRSGFGLDRCLADISCLRTQRQSVLRFVRRPTFVLRLAIVDSIGDFPSRHMPDTASSLRLFPA